ncbi:hypothetical protein DFJ67_6801 [Asanoa ferruginea]|uniref:Uncharacterized protein n=1 Tax=Asanoa ferruginea TaxID=53367 RepID=A0A3D9ZXA0_9ACTN|nr:hypothetical protein [Asanoa ferruginea]REG00744.1 hypothetical protein DFJ67_6801 [Asanoa ferruginea]GIF47381.1 hypothetical protein Afe04nite_19200 [Asanoa ferruginea]
MSRKTGKPSYVRQAEQARARRVPLAATIAGLVIAALVAGLVGYFVGRPDATTRAIDDIKAQEAKRDVDQIRDLTAVARRSQETLTTLLNAFDTAVDGTKPVDAATVKSWQETVKGLVTAHADSPSGTTATNVARGGFRGAVADFQVAVDIYAQAVAAPPEGRAALTAIAGRARTAAATAWSVAAAQLDQINVDAGFGHQHVYLETEQGSGAFTADGEEEGHTGG